MRTLRTLYLVFANTLVLFFFVLLAAHCLILLRERARTSSEYLQLSEVVRKNYEHMAVADVEALLRAHSATSFRYEPWVGFRVAAQASKFVNVSESGIRANATPDRNMSSLDHAIWFFGGSTAFGDGVGDAETIPAQVEKSMRKPVINFGVGGFYSAQENMLLAQYLKFGYRPDLVLFLDGINERCDILLYDDQMKLLFAKAQISYKWDVEEAVKPVVTVLRRISAKLSRVATTNSGTPDIHKLVCEKYGMKIPLREIHARNLAEREAICRLYAIDCITFVQPFAGLHGRHEDPTSFGNREYQLLQAKFAHLEGSWRAARSIFVTDALDKLEKHAYIDDVHYSAEASKLIAQEIADKIRARIR